MKNEQKFFQPFKTGTFTNYKEQHFNFLEKTKSLLEQFKIEYDNSLENTFSYQEPNDYEDEKSKNLDSISDVKLNKEN